ncbi:MAG: DUF6029 family protein [Paludibacter sp.]|nr:DUF6029 family protein [Paludibacter sp.]
MNLKKTMFFCVICAATCVAAQIKLGDWATLTGGVQTDNLLNAPKFDKFQDNSYIDFNINSKYIFAGLRLEYLQFPLPGYESDFAGYGIGNIFVTGKYKNAELTLGNFYDQFGSGLIFRTYEERSMGIDNSLFGARFKFTPYKGIYFKALGGKQRRYFKYNDSFVWGADVEINIDEWLRTFQQSGAYLMFGASYVGKHEKDEDIFPNGNVVFRLNLPHTLAAADFRARFQKGNISVLAEYAIKSQDPSADNNYVYHKGNAALASFSYSKKGISALVQAKRSDNMSFRSLRSMIGISSFINHLPAFTQQQTYALPSIYPYATQPSGEWAFQGDLSYNFQKKTALGGKYGTLIRLNVSHIREIKKNIEDGETDYAAPFFAMGKELYYQDINLTIDKKINSKFKLAAMYMFQKYNPKVIVNEEENMITSHIFVAEGKFNINRKFTLRSELQYLFASQYLPLDGQQKAADKRINQGDWAFALVELSVAPSFMFAVQDMYNAGATKKHYYMATGAYSFNSHRIQLGFGKTRAGYDCSGGVCRLVPETYGARLSYNYTF